jgi:peroxiredoxin
MLSEGTTAPDFDLPGLGEPGSGDDDDSRAFDEFHLEAILEDGPALLAFYPGDFSGPCTEELCSLRDIHLRQLDFYRVYGISRDSLFTHEAFAYQHELDFPLLSDVEGTVCEAYDAKHEKEIEG